MEKHRLVSFSDGVIAIIITIMVLELKVPHHGTLNALIPLIPVYLNYILSFMYIAIYWNNHHHMLQTSEKVTGGILWANMHLLFWLSLFPFVTAWMGENHFSAVPTALYGVVLLMAAIAYFTLRRLIIHSQGPNSILKKAIGKDFKGNLSLTLYIIAIITAPWIPGIAQALYALVAFMWLVPDRRIEKIFVEYD
ncbi:MAG: TMEM175 family protein [Gammaproteobacteria bacterium]